MSLVKSGQSITPTFTVTDPAGTGLINADSTPTGTVYVNGTADGATVTVTNLTTGKYKAAVTLPSLTAGQVVELMITAVVGGKTYAETVWTAIGDTQRISDSTPQTGDSYARLGAPAGVSVSADIASNTSSLATLLSRITGPVALAATALSNAVWTNGRGTNLDNLDAAVSSRSTYAGGAVTSVTDPVTVGTNNDKTGYGLSAAAVQTIWDALTSAMTTAGSIGKLLVDRIDAAISSRSTYAGNDTAGTTTLLSRVTALLQTKAEADTAHGLLATAADLATVAGYLDTEIAAILAAVDTEVAAIKAKTDNLPSDPADQSQVEAAITAAQGALAILIGALNDIAAADVWAALDDASANKVADHVLRRSWAMAAGSADGDTLAFRSLLGAVAKLVNRVGIVGNTLTVYEDDDTTALGAQTLTSDASAEPVTGANTI